MEVAIKVQLSDEDEKVEETILLSPLEQFDNFETLQQILQDKLSKNNELAGAPETLEDQNLFFRGKEITSTLTEHKQRDDSNRIKTLHSLGIQHEAELVLKLLPMQVTVLVKPPNSDTVGGILTLSPLGPTIT